MDQDSIERRAIGMYHEEWLVVDALANALARKSGGKPNVSVAMRTIIHERETLRDPVQMRRMDRMRGLARGFFAGKVTADEFAQTAALLVLGLVEPETVGPDGKDELPGNSGG